VRPVVVAGAGAAGLMAAIHAAAGGGQVIVVETTVDGGRKILISGGGRCNVLPQALEPQRFVSDAPAPLVRRLLRAWPLEHQKRFFEETLRVPLKLERESRKYFPVSDRARDVRDALAGAARGAGVEFRFNTRITGLTQAPTGWRVETSAGAIDAVAVIMATGGRSVPSTGSDGGGIEWLKRLGHRVVETYPALTPLTSDPPVHGLLAGVSLPVRIRARWNDEEVEATGGFLFTHRGYSGPSVLDVSHLAVRSRLAGGARASLRVRWSDLDDAAWHAAMQGHEGLVATALARKIPARLGEQLMGEAGVPPDRTGAELRRSERIALAERLTSYELPWTGDEGYRKAEVTGGGVALDEIDPRTLESRRAPGLFLCGELLDAFGPIGGHNFAWAWATGRAAGTAAVK
jgi:predicted Rossmann fold flavoprotein